MDSLLLMLAKEMQDLEKEIRIMEDNEKHWGAPEEYREKKEDLKTKLYELKELLSKKPL